MSGIVYNERPAVSPLKTTVYGSDLQTMAKRISNLRLSIQRCHGQNSPRHLALLDEGQRFWRILDRYRELSKDNPKAVKRINDLDERLQNVMWTLPTED
jgi:hypothetical protein